LLLKNIFYT